MDDYRGIIAGLTDLKRKYGNKSEEEIMELIKKEQEEERKWSERLQEDIRKQNIKMWEEFQKKEEEKIDYEKFTMDVIRGYITKEKFAETVNKMSEDEKEEYKRTYVNCLIRKREYDIIQLVEEECVDEQQRDVFKKNLFDLMHKRISPEEYIEEFSKLTNEERYKLLKIQKMLMKIDSLVQRSVQ